MIESDSFTRHPILTEDFQKISAVDLPWSELAGTTVLVTGANGFVPSYLVEALLYLNERRLSPPLKVLALVRNHAKALKRFEAYQGRQDLGFIVQDVSEPAQIDEPVHYIIHAASQASPRHFAVDPAGVLKPNVLGTHHLLELARQKKSRSFVFVSSGEVYGKFPSPPGYPISEQQYGSLDPMQIRSCYAEGKRAGEAICKAWSYQYGIPARIARLGHTYGPGMDLEDGRVFSDFVANIVRGENILMKSKGLVSRPFCYLSDAIIGMLAILLKGHDGEAYNLMNDEAETRIIDLARILCGLFPEKGLQVVEQPAQSCSIFSATWNPGFLVDTQKVRNLGWKPSISVETGFRRTIQYYNPV